MKCSVWAYDYNRLATAIGNEAFNLRCWACRCVGMTSNTVFASISPCYHPHPHPLPQPPSPPQPSPPQGPPPQNCSFLSPSGVVIAPGAASAGIAAERKAGWSAAETLAIADGKCGDLHHLETRVYLCSSRQVALWCVGCSSPLSSFRFSCWKNQVFFPAKSARAFFTRHFSLSWLTW